MTNRWRNRENDMFVGSIFAGIFAGGLTFLLLRLPFFVAIFVFFFVFLFVYDRTRAYHKTMVKIFAASFLDAQQVVQNVLQEKGLPYSIVGKNQYVIEDEVKIKLTPYQQQGLQGTAVSLTPHNYESQQLLFSLRQKLDEAFRPRGL